MSFIGSNIARSLNEKGETDLLLVDTPATDREIFNFKGLQYSKYLDKNSLKNFLTLAENVRAIFHMGACSSTTETDAEYLRENNFEYTRDLASWCLNNNAQFIYLSPTPAMTIVKTIVNYNRIIIILLFLS